MSDHQASQTKWGITFRDKSGEPIFTARSDEEKLSLIRDLAARAEAGHVASGAFLLKIAIAVLKDPRAEVSTALREWLGRVLSRLETNPNRVGVEAFAPRPAGDGRRPLYSDNLAARMRFEQIQMMGCFFAVVGKVLHQLKALAAFDYAAEMLVQDGFVNPITAKPYTAAAVRRWFYSAGYTFDVDSPDSPIKVSIQRTTSVE